MVVRCDETLLNVTIQRVHGAEVRVQEYSGGGMVVRWYGARVVWWRSGAVAQWRSGTTRWHSRYPNPMVILS